MNIREECLGRVKRRVGGGRGIRKGDAGWVWLSCIICIYENSIIKFIMLWIGIC